MKKLTHEEFIEKLLLKNKHFANDEFELIGEYTHSHNHIDCRCKICGHEWSAPPSSLLNGYGCHLCRIKSWKISQGEFMERLESMHENIIALDEYEGMDVKIRFQCEKHHIWLAEPHNVLRGSGCPYCADRSVLIGYNDLWSTRPDIAKLLEDPNDGYKYAKSAHNKVNFKCPDCGAILEIRINDVYNRGFSCSRCGDGISYPNKFARAVLEQLPVKNIDYEYDPDWLKPYFYDNYFEYMDKKYILEMDGGLGHGKRKFGSKDQDTEGAKRDKYKDSLAREHDLNIIRVDCDYKTNTRFEYIKNNLLSSDLNKIVDLSKIDWIFCDKVAQKNLVKQACEIYMSGVKNLNEIANILCVDRTTIHRYVKIGAKYGWCDYNPNSWKLPIIIVDNNNNIIKEFDTASDCKKYILKEYNIKLDHKYLVDACKTHKPYKGFNFRFANETIQN